MMAGMSPPIESSIIRIFSKNDTVVGAGFLISERHVITCAHVVADASNIPRTTLQQPDEEIRFDFPLIDPSNTVNAKVVFWLPMLSREPAQPDGNEDIAVLEITNGLSQSN